MDLIPFLIIHNSINVQYINIISWIIDNIIEKWDKLV